MIKLKVDSNKGEWFLNKYGKGKHLEPQLVRLTRTQKRRMQRKRSIQKMRNIVTMLDQAKHVEQEEVASPKAEIIQNMQGWIQNLNHAQTAETSAKRVQTIETKLSDNLIDEWK